MDLNVDLDVMTRLLMIPSAMFVIITITGRVAYCHRYRRYVCVIFLEVWSKIFESNMYVYALLTLCTQTGQVLCILSQKQISRDLRVFGVNFELKL